MVGETVGRLLEAKESELVAKLAQGRAKLLQSGDRGDAAEIAFRDFLGASVPRRLDVGHGEIIDAGAGRSRQMDVVVTTEDHPFRPVVDQPNLYLVEGVFAAGEVKSRLTTQELEDAIRKGRSVKQLSKRHLPGEEVYASPSDHRRWVEGSVPFFLFCYENSVHKQTLVDRLAGEAEAIDAVFILGQGTAIDYGDGAGSFQLHRMDGSLISGWAWSEGQPILMHLLGWIHALPRVLHRQSVFLNYLAQTPGEGRLTIRFPRG